MPKIATPLQRAAAEQDDAQTVEEARGLFARLGALLGIGASAAAPEARMTKKTLTTKRVEMEESDDDMEEEEEAGTSDTGATQDSDNDGSAAGSQDEERGEADDEEEESASEEEEEKAIAAARVAPMKAAEAAYAKAIAGHPLAAALAIRSPRRVERQVRKATGARTIGAAMTVLSREHAAAETASAKHLAAQAQIEQRVNRIEKDTKREKVDALVMQGKREMRAGATTKEGRAMLREYGMTHGATKLSAFLAAQPRLARSAEEDGALRENVRRDAAKKDAADPEAIIADMTAGMSPEKAAAARADFQKRLNGATGATNGGAK
jgi:hypothetical protein